MWALGIEEPDRGFVRTCRVCAHWFTTEWARCLSCNGAIEGNALASINDEKEVDNRWQRQGKKESRDWPPVADWSIRRSHREHPEHNGEPDNGYDVDIFREPEARARPEAKKANRRKHEEQRVKKIYAFERCFPHDWNSVQRV